jgi:hypothetical protein
VKQNVLYIIVKSYNNIISFQKGKEINKNYLYNIPLEQLYKSPGCPLIVKASETIGSPPVARASSIIANTSPLKRGNEKNLSENE